MQRPGGHASERTFDTAFYTQGHGAPRYTCWQSFVATRSRDHRRPFMPIKILQIVMLTLLYSAGPLLAQNGAPPSTGNPPSSATPPARARQEPCWQQAGISRSVMEQHHSIEMDAHSQVASVCENSSLTPQQKQQQAREIRQQAQQKMGALITPEQQSALHSCQQQRAANGSPNGSHRPGGAGPCGNFAASQGRQGPSNGRAGGSNPQPPADTPQN